MHTILSYLRKFLPGAVVSAAVLAYSGRHWAVSLAFGIACATLIYIGCRILYRRHAGQLERIRCSGERSWRVEYADVCVGEIDDADLAMIDYQLDRDIPIWTLTMMDKFKLSVLMFGRALIAAAAIGTAALVLAFMNHAESVSAVLTELAAGNADSIASIQALGRLAGLVLIFCISVSTLVHSNAIANNTRRKLVRLRRIGEKIDYPFVIPSEVSLVRKPVSQREPTVDAA